MLLTDILFLQAGGSGLIQFLPLVGIALVFYFFMLRPQMKKQNEQITFGNSLEKGQEVVTTGGIIGRINKIEGHIVTLQVAQNTFIRVTKNVISKEMTEAFANGTEEPASNA